MKDVKLANAFRKRTVGLMMWTFVKGSLSANLNLNQYSIRKLEIDFFSIGVIVLV